MAADNGTARSHNVWRHYLTSFSIDQKNVHRYDLTNKKNQCLPTFQIGVVKDLYRTRKQITQEDVSFFKKERGIINPIETDKLLFSDLINYINNDFPLFYETYFEAREWLYGEKAKNYTLKFERNQEEIFSLYENSFFPLYERLIRGDIDWYNSLIDGTENPVSGYIINKTCDLMSFYQRRLVDIFCLIAKNEPFIKKLDKKSIKRKIKYGIDVLKNFPINGLDYSVYSDISRFLLFLSTQYFRTNMNYNKLIHNANILMGNDEKLNPYSYPVMYIHYQVPATAYRYIENNCRIYFLENTTNIPLITSDQPIINLIPEDKVNDYPVPELYYPLTPNSAIIFKQKNGASPHQKLTEDDVAHYNTEIAKRAERYLYASEDLSSRRFAWNC